MSADPHGRNFACYLQTIDDVNDLRPLNTAAGMTSQSAASDGSPLNMRVDSYSSILMPLASTRASARRGALPKFLCRQRWFPAKDSGEPNACLVCLIPLLREGMRVAVALWRITPSSGQSFAMFVPLAIVPPDTVEEAEVIAIIPDESRTGMPLALVEAFGVDEFVREWVSVHLEGSAPDALMSVGRMIGLNDARVNLRSSWAIRRIEADQSNTSIRISDDAILKVIRKVEEGAAL
jgi:hypothetical protein